MAKKRSTTAKKPVAHKTRRKETKKSASSLIVWALGIVAAITVGWILLSSLQKDPPSGSVSDNPEIQALIDTADKKAETGSAQEALDAYNKLMDASKGVDQEVWGTAEANASTFQAIVDAEKYNEKMARDQADKAISETEDN